MNKPTKWFLRSQLAGAVVASFLTIGLRGFGDQQEGTIVQNERRLIQDARRSALIPSATKRSGATR